MSDHANAQLITRFYTAFQRRDADTMASCYHAEAHFSDPVFTDLRGPQVGAMWRMLAGRAKDMEITFRDVRADDATGSAHWEPVYTYSVTGRKVHNIIDATFRFKDGLIVDHSDQFDLWRWTRLALGPVGVALGWSGPLQNKIRRTADAALKAYIAGQVAR